MNLCCTTSHTALLAALAYGIVPSLGIAQTLSLSGNATQTVSSGTTITTATTVTGVNNVLSIDAGGAVARQNSLFTFGGAGAQLSVTNNGAITGSSGNAAVFELTAGSSAASGYVFSLTNTGTITNANSGGSNARVINDNAGNTNVATRSLTVLNAAGASISSSEDAIRLNSAVVGGTVTITNAGTIRTTGTATDTGGAALTSNTGQAIDFNGLTAGSTAISIVNQATGVISAVNADAIRSGNMAVRAGGSIDQTALATASETAAKATLDARFAFSGAIENAGTIRSETTFSLPDLTGQTLPVMVPNTVNGGNTINNDAVSGPDGGSVRVVNAGSISGFRHAIDGGASTTTATRQALLDSAGLVSVTNSGSIVGRNGSGVGSDGHGIVINTGTIQGLANGYQTSNLGRGGDGDGVDIDLLAFVDNAGVIEGVAAFGNDSGGRPNGADGIAAGGGTIINRSGALIRGGTNGILIDDGGDGGAYAATFLRNQGTIRSDGIGGLPNPGSRVGHAVAFVGEFADRIINEASGVITGTRVGISTGAGNDIVINDGRIEATDPTGIAVDLGDGDDTLTNSGTIVGSVDGGAGTDILTTSGNSVINGVIRNFETINGAAFSGTTLLNATLSALSVSANSTTTVAGNARVTNDVTVDDTGLLQISGGTLTANAVRVSTGGTLRARGAIVGNVDVAAGGRLAPGNSPGLATVTGNATLAGTLEIEIDGATPATAIAFGAGTHDQLAVSGTATLGGTIAPRLGNEITGAANGTFVPALGQGFVAVSAGSLTGAFANVSASANQPANTRFLVGYTATTATLFLTPASYANIAANGLEQTSNRRAIGTAVDALVVQTPDPTTRAGLNALFGQSGARIGGALDDIAGQVNTDAPRGALAASRAFGGAIGERLSLLRGPHGGAALRAQSGASMHLAFAGTGASGLVLPVAGDAMAQSGPNAAVTAPTWSIWARPVIGFGTSAGTGVSDAKMRVAGGLVGADREIGDGLRVGAAAGIARARVDVGAGDADIDSHQGLLYGLYVVGGAFADLTLGYAHNRYESARSVLGLSARGETTGQTLSAGLGVGYRFALDSLSVEPRAGVQWDRVRRDGFTETGAGGFSQAVGATTQEFARASIEARASTVLVSGADWSVEPAATLGYAHDFGDTSLGGVNRMAGSTLRVEGTDPGRHGLIAGLGVAVQAKGGLTLQADWRGEFRERESAHAILLGVGLRF